MCTAERDLLVIGHLSLDAPPLGSQPLRRADAAPPAGELLPLDLVLVLHLQLRYPVTQRQQSGCVTHAHTHSRHTPADEVEVVLLRPLRPATVLPVQVVQPLGAALFF